MIEEEFFDKIKERKTIMKQDKKKKNFYIEEETRINKYLAQAGICSRRDADKLILEGKVMVNGRVAEPGTKVSGRDKISVSGKAVGGRQETAVLAYYKPVGVICSERDKHAEKLLSKQFSYPVRVTYAGRLDKDSEGLLLLTNDGILIDSLMRGKNKHEKEYVVKVKTDITEEFLQNMSQGVYLTELEKKTRPCKIEQTGKYTVRIVLTQGLNRQIRRMCKELGYEVHSLKRVRVANIELGRLRPGEYRKLEGKELSALYEIAGLYSKDNNENYESV